MQYLRVIHTSNNWEEGKDIEDEHLVDLILAGDSDAFRLLIERHSNYIFQTAYGVLRHVRDAEDVAQEAFIQIYLSLPRYQRKGLKSWMVRITINKAIDHKRKLIRRNEQSMVEDANAPPNVIQDQHANTEQQAISNERQRLVERNVNHLPNNYREVIIAHYIEEKSYQQIAQEQGVELKTVASKLHRAKLWMKKHWKEDDYV
ncbi:MAG: sigma-70 family RNA polymerase sigma factor [Paenibacillaceae bacterium]